MRTRGPTVAQIKREARITLEYMRKEQEAGTDFSDARCVGAAWSTLARICGDTGPAPWRKRMDSEVRA